MLLKERKDIISYQESEEYNDLDALPWEYGQEELSEINFSAFTGIEITDNLNSYKNKLEEEIYPNMKKDESYKEEKSFESGLNLNLTKKRNRLNSNEKQNIDINYNIIKKASIFTIEKINKKNKYTKNDFTQTTFKFFKTPKFHTFNPLFKKKNKKIFILKKTLNFPTLNKQKKYAYYFKISFLNLKQLKDSK